MQLRTRVYPNNNQGFTILEVLVAMLILAIGLLGALAGVMAALEANAGNTMRNEAIKIAQEQLEVARNTNFAAVQSFPQPIQIQRQFRKGQVTYTVNRTVLTNNSVSRVSIDVQWTHKRRQKNYALQTVLRQ